MGQDQSCFEEDVQTTDPPCGCNKSAIPYCQPAAPESIGVVLSPLIQQEGAVSFGFSFGFRHEDLLSALERLLKRFKSGIKDGMRKVFFKNLNKHYREWKKLDGKLRKSKEYMKWKNKKKLTETERSMVLERRDALNKSKGILLKLILIMNSSKLGFWKSKEKRSFNEMVAQDKFVPLSSVVIGAAYGSGSSNSESESEIDSGSGSVSGSGSGSY